MNLRKWRWPLSVLGVLVIGSFVAAVMFGSGSAAGTLDPGSASSDGAKALATLLREQGITVSTVRTTADAVTAVQAAGSDTTLLVTDPYLLVQSQVNTLATLHPGRLVLLEADEQSADILAPGVIAYPSSSSAAPVDPGCADADATAAGNADIGDGQSYTVPTAAGTCYPIAGSDGGYALVTTSGPASPDTVLVGSRTPFRNDQLANDGNAALALRLLGKHGNIVWYLPDTADPAVAADGGAGQKTFLQVIPAGWSWATLQLAIAALLLAVWQARRLGPVVVENLPVVVRAAETVEGRARLYERGKVQGRAADALREAALHRLATRLGLPRSASANDVAAALATRGGRPAVETLRVLAGPPPSDDRQLVRLAEELDVLEAEVGRL